VTPSLAALVIANAIPLVGVLFLGWTVFPLVFLYWLENVVVGASTWPSYCLRSPAASVLAREGLARPVLPRALRGFTYVHGCW